MMQRWRKASLLRPFISDSLAKFSTEVAPAKGELAVVSGVPSSIYDRKVTIFAPSRTASQQGMSRTVEGQSKGPSWKIEFPTQEKWENPLIGWTSTADPLECVARSAMSFHTKEEAIGYCDRYGFKYEVREPLMRRKDRAKRFAGYGDNYSVRRGGIPEGGLPSERK